MMIHWMTRQFIGAQVRSFLKPRFFKGDMHNPYVCGAMGLLYGVNDFFCLFFCTVMVFVLIINEANIMINQNSNKKLWLWF